MKLSRASILIVTAAVLLSTLWLYFTHFYYDEGPFRLGIRNDTPDVLMKVTVRLEPRGEKSAGILSPGNASWEMDPHLPVPTNVFVFFTDPKGAAHSLSTTGAPPKFRGSICVVITKSNDYAAHLELERRK